MGRPQPARWRITPAAATPAGCRRTSRHLPTRAPRPASVNVGGLDARISRGTASQPTAAGGPRGPGRLGRRGKPGGPAADMRGTRDVRCCFGPLLRRSGKPLCYPPVADYPGDNCERLRATRSDRHRKYPQLERLMEVFGSWSADSLASLTRKSHWSNPSTAHESTREDARTAGPAAHRLGDVSLAYAAPEAGVKRRPRSAALRRKRLTHAHAAGRNGECHSGRRGLNTHSRSA